MSKKVPVGLKHGERIGLCQHFEPGKEPPPARIAEAGFDKLKAPIRRVVTLDVPVPYSPRLEEFISPSESRINEAIHAVLG